MIDIRKLKELVRLMVSNELTELDLRDSEEQVTLRRGLPGPDAAPAPTAAANPPAPPPAPAPAPPPAEPSTGDGSGREEAGLVPVACPMVGTFYAAPNPDAAPFVTVGTEVTEDAVVCIIEAMKIFNEIKAETSGTIARILVQNGESVEFGQTLFLVRPG